MKKVLFMMSILLSIGMLGACNKSDDLSNVTEGQPMKESTENGDGNQTLFQGTTDDMVDFQLQNADGIECYNFNEGDNIIFRLEIKNDTDKDIIVRPLCEIIGFDVFRVYTVNGDNMGTPWDQLGGTSKAFDVIGAHSSCVILCPWFDIPELAYFGHEHCYSDCFYKKEERLPLPKGEYYSTFIINLNDKKITCNRNFIIL